MPNHIVPQTFEVVVARNFEDTCYFAELQTWGEIPYVRSHKRAHPTDDCKIIVVYALAENAQAAIDRCTAYGTQSTKDSEAACELSSATTN